MLDTAGLIVEAVWVTFPESVRRCLKEHPNPKTRDGGYRPMKRYVEGFNRKHLVAVVCRRCWYGYRKAGDTNRRANEPFHEYLPMDLVARCVRRLRQEFRARTDAFVPPFPSFATPQMDYEIWEMRAVRGVQEMLEMEVELGPATASER